MAIIFRFLSIASRDRCTSESISRVTVSVEILAIMSDNTRSTCRR